MTELIPITTNDEGTQAVMGRDLHAFLESKEPYTRWLSRHIEKYGFVAGQDFMTEMSESTGGRPAENHILTMDMAKELGYRNVPDMTRRLDDDEKGMHSTRILGGAQELTTVGAVRHD